jgi:hypothetical protein
MKMNRIGRQKKTHLEVSYMHTFIHLLVHAGVRCLCTCVEYVCTYWKFKYNSIGSKKKTHLERKFHKCTFVEHVCTYWKFKFNSIGSKKKTHLERKFHKYVDTCRRVVFVYACGMCVYTWISRKERVNSWRCRYSGLVYICWICVYVLQIYKVANKKGRLEYKLVSYMYVSIIQCMRTNVKHVIAHVWVHFACLQIQGTVFEQEQDDWWHAYQGGANFEDIIRRHNPKT